MREPVSGRIRAWSVLLALVLAAPAVTAQEPADEKDALHDVLCAEVSTSHGLLATNRPVWVRFTLRNTSDEPVRIPLPAGSVTNGGIALPVEIVFGSADNPALEITYEAEQPAAITPPPPSSDVGASELLLAPRGSIGTEVDLREHFVGLRYAGCYRIEWSPLDGRIEPAAVEFRVEPRKEAILVTDKGKVTFTLAYDTAPRNVENFLELVREGFYDGKTIHGIIPGGLLQGGCPKGDGSGIRPDGKLIPAEFNDTPFTLGTLAMAHKPSDPNSASCQFFVALARLPKLDGQYTIIGQASDEESLRALSRIAAEPTDAKYRPRLPLVIRSINLVDVERSGVTRLGLKPEKTAPPPASTPTSESDRDEP